MSNRITITHLRRAIDALNTDCGMPTQVWTRQGNDNVAHVGCYVLDAAYGGYRLCQIVNPAGGERDITPRYGAAAAYDLIHAYHKGLRAGCALLGGSVPGTDRLSA